MTLKVEHVPITALHPFDKNPRVITDASQARLRKSLTRYGLYKPLLGWKDAEGTGVIVGGNQRLTIMEQWRKAGTVPDTVNVKKIPVIWLDVTEAEARAIALRDNNSDGEWDWDALPNYVRDLRDLMGGDEDLDALTGFDGGTLEDLAELATAPDLDLERFTSTDDETNETPPPAPPDPPAGDTGRQFAKFVVGNVRGKIPMGVYGEFLEVFEAYSQEANSTDIPTIFKLMLAKLKA